MPFLVCIVPICPMRAMASHKSEQTSQLLFGDVTEILETSGDFVHVKYLYDDYEGWCQRSQMAEINAAQFNGMEEQLSMEWINEVWINGQPMQIPLGCQVGHALMVDTLWDNYKVTYRGKHSSPITGHSAPHVIKTIALQYLNTSYQWGGRSVFGVDCSGFCQTIFRFAGMPLLRDAWQQASQGEAIGFLAEGRLGDLAFFDNEEGRITHVGMLLDQQSIIHASGKVRIDTLDHEGIVNRDTGLRTHRLRVIKRVL